VFKFLLLVLFALPAAWGGDAWLTIVGDPTNAVVDTIQVDPIPVSVSGDLRTMRVRVNRVSERNNWDGIPYRSYESSVLFDCGSNTARYLEIKFYLQPLWLGQAHTAVAYPSTMPRWMLFGGVEPSPYQRIIYAACESMGRR
jgi:hypothetical protein